MTISHNPRIELADVASKWDQDERIGDAFVASFSKSMVLEAYSDFINNFTDAMEVAKTESKRKSAFADFLKVKIAIFICRIKSNHIWIIWIKRVRSL